MKKLLSHPVLQLSRVNTIVALDTLCLKALWDKSIELGNGHLRLTSVWSL